MSDSPISQHVCIGIPVMKKADSYDIIVLER